MRLIIKGAAALFLLYQCSGVEAALCPEREIFSDTMEPFSSIAGCSGVYAVAYHCRKRSVGKVWDKVPFPLLIMPNANLSYTIQPESYSLMNAMKFMNDEYFSWDVTYFLNGWLFNHV